MRLISLPALLQRLTTGISNYFFLIPRFTKGFFFSNGLLLLLLMAGFATCRQPVPLPPGDKDNGGLLLPGGFDAVVVADSIGRTRHIAVNDNGDIYVKLTYNDIMHGAGGTAAIRDNNNDGKADIIAYFGDTKMRVACLPASGSITAIFTRQQ
jgi:hypothetical protein